jgi:hypothetical protein
MKPPGLPFVMRQFDTKLIEFNRLVATVRRILAGRKSPQADSKFPQRPAGAPDSFKNFCSTTLSVQNDSGSPKGPAGRLVLG